MCAHCVHVRFTICFCCDYGMFLYVCCAYDFYIVSTQCLWLDMELLTKAAGGLWYSVDQYFIVLFLMVVVVVYFKLYFWVVQIFVVISAVFMFWVAVLVVFMESCLCGVYDVTLWTRCLCVYGVPSSSVSSYVTGPGDHGFIGQDEFPWNPVGPWPPCSKAHTGCHTRFFS